MRSNDENMLLSVLGDWQGEKRVSFANSYFTLHLSISKVFLLPEMGMTCATFQNEIIL
jgi:hypothetical protein